MDTPRTSQEAELSERLRPYVEVTLTFDLVTSDRCKRIKAPTGVACRYAGEAGGGRHYVRVWRLGTMPQDGLTCLLDELELATLATVPA